jgi:hypothetical protein
MVVADSRVKIDKDRAVLDAVEKALEVKPRKNINL